MSFSDKAAALEAFDKSGKDGMVINEDYGILGIIKKGAKGLKKVLKKHGKKGKKIAKKLGKKDRTGKWDPMFEEPCKELIREYESNHGLASNACEYNGDLGACIECVVNGKINNG